MKSLRWIATAAASVLVGLILTAWLGKPIENFFRDDRIEAAVILAPWRAKPELGKKSNSETDVSTSSSDDVLEHASITLGDSERIKVGYVEISLRNESEKTITDAKIRLGDNLDLVVLEKSGGQPDVVRQSVDEIELPDMKPGDKLTYHIWEDFYTEPKYVLERIKTFSSSGSFRIYSSSIVTGSIGGGLIGDFLEEWWNTIFVITILILLVGAFTLAIQTDEKLKSILKDRTVYQKELERYRKNPSSYNALESDDIRLTRSLSF